jgi:predicted metal-binding membrane protein
MNGRVAPRPHAGTVAATVVVAAAACWLALAAMTASMGMAEQAPGLGDAAMFLGAWMVMMGAMMLPPTLPAMLLHAAVARSRGLSALFAAGYLAVWALLGLLAYAVVSILQGRLLSMGDWGPASRPLAALALGAAAAYQLTPIKRLCLARCRAPMAQVVLGWRDGPWGALSMGARHGLWCAACCAGLMLVLLSLGAMNVVWMLLLSLVILAEKATPLGHRVGHAAAGLLALLAVAVAASPEVLPWLT